MCIHTGPHCAKHALSLTGFWYPQVICKAQNVHYSLFPVANYAEMQQICAVEFRDEEVRGFPQLPESMSHNRNVPAVPQQPLPGHRSCF